MKQKWIVSLAALAAAACILPLSVFASQGEGQENGTPAPPSTAGVVAQVDRQEFSTLAEAFALANQNGGTVKLVADAQLDQMIAVTGEVTLDLNGFTLKDAAAQPGWMFQVGDEDGAGLTLTNTGKNLFAKSASGEVQLTQCGFAHTLNNGKLILEGTKITQTAQAQQPVLQVSDPTGSLEIKSGAVQAESQIAVVDGAFTMTDGTLESKNFKGPALALRYGPVTISGGTVQSLAGKGVQFGDDSPFTQTEGQPANDPCGGAVNVTGGSITASSTAFTTYGSNVAISGVKWESANGGALRNYGTAVVADGSFRGIAGAVNARTANPDRRAFVGNITIKGGEFLSNDSEKATNGFENNNALPENASPEQQAQTVKALIQGGTFVGKNNGVWNSGELVVENGTLEGKAYSGLENHGTAVVKGGTLKSAGTDKPAARNFNSLDVQGGTFTPSGSSCAIEAELGSTLTQVAESGVTITSGSPAGGSGVVTVKAVAQQAKPEDQKKMEQAIEQNSELKGRSYQFYEVTTIPAGVDAPVRYTLDYPSSCSKDNAGENHLEVWRFDNGFNKLTMDLEADPSKITMQSKPGLMLVVWGTPAEVKPDPQPQPNPEPEPEPTPTPPPYDWGPHLTKIYAVGQKGEVTIEVGDQIAVPNGVWQAIYGKDVTLTIVRGSDRFVFNGLDLKASGFAPDSGHNLTDLTGYIGRKYHQPATTAVPKPSEAPKPTETPKPTAAPTPTPKPTMAPTPAPTTQPIVQPVEEETEKGGLGALEWTLIGVILVALVILAIVVGRMVWLRRQQNDLRDDYDEE